MGNLVHVFLLGEDDTSHAPEGLTRHLLVVHVIHLFERLPQLGNPLLLCHAALLQCGKGSLLLQGHGNQLAMHYNTFTSDNYSTICPISTSSFHTFPTSHKFLFCSLPPNQLHHIIYFPPTLPPHRFPITL